LDRTFAERYPVQQAGGSTILELWVPAEDLEDFNRHLIGPIQVVAEYRRSSQPSVLEPVRITCVELGRKYLGRENLTAF
jgi:hypothetical protein